MIEAIAVINSRKEEITKEMDGIIKTQEMQKKLGLKSIKKLDEVYDELYQRLIKLEQARIMLFNDMIKDDPAIKELEDN